MSIHPLIPKVPSTDEARPKGEPLPRLLKLHAANRLPALASSTQATYRQTYQLAVSLGDHPSAGQVGVWVTWLRGRYPPPEGCTDSWTVHLHWHNLAAIYSWAKEWGFASGANPAAILALKKPEPRARAAVELPELWQALLGACHDDRERALLTTARHSAARRGELLGLMPRDLVTHADPWRLRFERQRKANTWTTGPLKEHANRALPVVAAELRQALLQLITAGAPRVWVGRGCQELVESPFLFPYREHDLGDLKRRLAAVAPGVFPPGDFLHVLRHTLAVELDRTGASNEEVQKQLGHRDVKTTVATYINRFARPVDAAPLQRLEKMRRQGVTAWGAPPGKGAAPPPGSAAGRRSGARPAATGRAPRPDEQFTPSRGEQSCGPRSQSKDSSSKSGSGRRRSSRAQRALPGLAVGPVVRKRSR